jgi:hypothetical protein
MRAVADLNPSGGFFVPVNDCEQVVDPLRDYSEPKVERPRRCQRVSQLYSFGANSKSGGESQAARVGSTFREMCGGG